MILVGSSLPEKWCAGREMVQMAVQCDSGEGEMTMRKVMIVLIILGFKGVQCVRKCEYTTEIQELFNFLN